MSKQKVGFIGCGRMGGPMAANLLNAGFKLTIHDTNEETLQSLVNRGAEARGSAASVATDADVVIMMLHNPVVAEVMNSVLQTLRPGKILIDHGNGDPRAGRQRFQQCKDLSVHFLDAGASGGRAGADAGTLAIMVGGEREVFNRALPLFEAMGQTVAYMGSPGAGHLSKVVNNLIVHGTWTLVGEALAFAERQGLNMPSLVSIMASGAARSYIMDTAIRVFGETLGEDWRSDLQAFVNNRAGPYQESWALEMADEIGHPLPMVSLVNELAKMYQANGEQPNAEIIDKIQFVSGSWPWTDIPPAESQQISNPSNPQPPGTNQQNSPPSSS